jgi:hypothetical protein
MSDEMMIVAHHAGCMALGLSSDDRRSRQTLKPSLGLCCLENNGGEILDLMGDTQGVATDCGIR